MDKKVFTPPPISTYQHHKHQVLWQIFVPLFLAILILLVVGVFAGIGTFDNPVNGTRWAGVAIIGLIIPVFLAGVIFLLLLGFISYGLSKLLQITPIYSLIARTYVFKIAFFIHQWADRFVEPVIKPKIAWAGLRGVFSALNKNRKQSL